VTVRAEINIGGTVFDLVEEDVSNLFDSMKTLAEGAGEFLDNVATIKQLAIAKGAFQAPAAEKAAAAPKQAQSGPASPDAPECKHGPMKDCAGMGYKKRWYCPKRGKDKECWAKD
jgi:hypothetical protein